MAVRQFDILRAIDKGMMDANQNSYFVLKLNSSNSSLVMLESKINEIHSGAGQALSRQLPGIIDIRQR